jgi:hypothetical protein
VADSYASIVLILNSLMVMEYTMIGSSHTDFVIIVYDVFNLELSNRAICNRDVHC